MGLSISVPVTGEAPLHGLIATLAAAGHTCSVMMVDGQLCAPTAPPPGAWREARLRTPAGTVTLKRPAPAAVEIVVFGNATPALTAMQQAVATALTG